MWQGGVPAEVEEATRESKRIVLVSLVVGIVLLALAAYIGVVTYLTPGLPFVGLPLVALVLFALMGVMALYVGLIGVNDARKLWESGNYPKAFQGLHSIFIAACLGGVVPGVFVFRTMRTLHPLTEAAAHGAAPVTHLCPSCSAPLDPRDKFCRVCGAQSLPS